MILQDPFRQSRADSGVAGPAPEFGWGVVPPDGPVAACLMRRTVLASLLLSSGDAAGRILQGRLLLGVTVGVTVRLT